MEAAIKKIPYGMTDFESIIRDGYYYVDKTQYIENKVSLFSSIRQSNRDLFQRWL